MLLRQGRDTNLRLACAGDSILDILLRKDTCRAGAKQLVADLVVRDNDIGYCWVLRWWLVGFAQSGQGKEVSEEAVPFCV